MLTAQDGAIAADIARFEEMLRDKDDIIQSQYAEIQTLRRQNEAIGAMMEEGVLKKP